MQTGRRPIYTALQMSPEDRNDGPIPFLSNLGGKVGYIQGELEWRLFDFCRIHQIVYKEVLSIDSQLSKIKIEPLNSNIEAEENIYISRQLDYVIGEKNQINRVTSFVDHMTIVELWAIAEQFLGETFKAFVSQKNSVSKETVTAPYKWDDFKREFKNVGIDLTTCENFQNANECRVLNNSIKHEPLVKSKLLQFAYFAPFSGKPLEQVPLEMQRYLNGVSDFLGSSIEKADEELEK